MAKKPKDLIMNEKLDETDKQLVLDNINILKDSCKAYMHVNWQKAIKAYTMVSIDRARELHELGHPELSNFYKPFIRKRCNRLFNQLFDTQIEFEVHEMGSDKSMPGDESSSENKIKSITEDRMGDPDNRKNLFTGIKSQVVLGNGFYKAWISYEDKYPKPSIEEVGSFSLFFNWNYDFYEDGITVIERKIKPKYSIAKELITLGIDPKYTLDRIEDLETGDYKSDTNDEAIWDLRMIQDRYVEECKSRCCNNEDPIQRGQNYINNRFKSGPTKTTTQTIEDGFYHMNGTDVHELYYYWDYKYLYIVIDDQVFGRLENPISKGEIGVPYHPYIKLDIDPNSGRSINQGYGVILHDDQVQINDIHNKFADQINYSTTINATWIKEGDGEVHVRNKAGKGTVDENNIFLTPGDVIEVEENTRLRQNQYQIDGSILNIMQYMESEGDNTAGLTSITGGTESGIQRVPFAAKSLAKVTIQELQPVIEGISHGLSRTVDVWLRLLLNYMNKENKNKIKIRTRQGCTIDLTKGDLEKRYHIKFSNKSITTLYTFESALQRIDALGRFMPLFVDADTGRSYINPVPILKSVMKSLDFPEDVVMSIDDMYKKQQKVAKKEIESQKKLLKPQLELERMITEEQARIQQDLQNQQVEQQQIQQPIIDQVGAGSPDEIDFGNIDNQFV